jgi:hypothetical protein
MIGFLSNYSLSADRRPRDYRGKKKRKKRRQREKKKRSKGDHRSHRFRDFTDRRDKKRQNPPASRLDDCLRGLLIEAEHLVPRTAVPIFFYDFRSYLCNP